MEIRENDGRNPIIIISEEEFHAWVRQKANEAGFSDRQLCAVQVSLDGDDTVLQGIPKVVVMVSNISDRPVHNTDLCNSA